jgi:tetratricopeptide (TPR) repeat protein
VRGRPPAAGRPLAAGGRRPLALVGCALAALVGLASGCASSPPPPEAPPSEAELRARIQENSLDPWPHHALARLHEERGEYEQAIQSYGRCINLLKPRSATRPVLDLGVLHHRLGSPTPAERCYGEVLATVASDPRSYRENDDYKVAALGMQRILTARGDEEALRALRGRFLDELGGNEGQWERGPLWLTPLESPPGRSPGDGEARTEPASPQ